ncbi:hypothetical protein ACMU_04595 [Actibacterium mucosum KCTC 23349]|uniref:MAPEG family protein n=1 Tax=Actibacterium mucosum KCTC 23349 TaxID=1454373 RepID=A0A037ZEF9_9RHOB|nr:MAPEG family protein [Actibacterium mucosum]KAJ53988.1 hypothetical protein ACMU_04595 [Actibacterium mucosum KCTC 23349]
MEQWLVAGTVVYFLTIMTPATILFFRIGFMQYLGPRDTLPEPGKAHARAIKADANSRENFPIFIGLGILALIVPEAHMEQALLGTQMYVLARIAYVPIYLAGIPFLRSAAYMVGWIGLILMGLAVI